jgi:hypothetical protein
MTVASNATAARKLSILVATSIAMLAGIAKLRSPLIRLWLSVSSKKSIGGSVKKFVCAQSCVPYLQRLAVPFLVLLLFSAIPFQARADNAEDCIKIVGVTPPVAGDPTRRSQIMKNVCDRSVGVMWCHEEGGKELPQAFPSVCRLNGKFYHQRRLMKPGETYDNYFSLPANGRIHLAACFDNQFYLKQKDDAGPTYYCDYPKTR